MDHNKEKFYIAVDLDGTLLNNDGNVSEYDRLALKECQKKGNRLIINTARSFARTKKYSRIINANYVNCFNGNLVIKSDQIIYKNCIDDEIVKRIMASLNQKKIKIIVELFDEAIKNFVEEDLFQARYCNFEKCEITECYKIIILLNNNDKIIENELKKYCIFYSKDARNQLIKVLPEKSDKFNGLMKITSSNNLISFGNDEEDIITLKNSFLGIKMDNSSKKLRRIKLSTQSNNDSGIGKFLNTFFNINYDTKNIRILDCTLRDGGHLNKSYFGIGKIESIIRKLILANIDIVEIGFLEECLYDKNFARFPNISTAEKLLKNIDCKKTIISLLTQVDKYDIDKLEKYNEGKVKFIRVSFHDNLIDMGMKYCDNVMKKGYYCACNPINFSGYTNIEIINLIKKVNVVKPDYFTIVDTFGIMLNNEFLNKLILIDKLLDKKIKLGLHLHDNLSSSFSTAQILIQNGIRRKVIIDTSVAGMGRSPGNLKTELLAYFINTHNKIYEMPYIYSIMENEIEKMRKKYNWNFNFKYSISAFEKTHRTYAEYLIEHNINLNDAEKIIKMIPSNKKRRFDLKVISDLCEKYFDRGEK